MRPFLKLSLAAAVLLSLSTVAEARGGSSTGSYGTGSSSSSHSVSGYTTRAGTVVAPSHATNPNTTQKDNFTAKGNVNTYTGKVGTKPAAH